MVIIKNFLVYTGFGLVVVFFLYGYCYLVATPRVLKRAGRKQLSESYLQFGNLLLGEHELGKLVAEGDESAKLLMRVINITKRLFLILTLLLVVQTGILLRSN